jgi:hypothetical protein
MVLNFFGCLVEGKIIINYTVTDPNLHPFGKLDPDAHLHQSEK